MTGEPVAELTARLEDVLAGVEVRELRQLSGGASRETWSFTASGPDGVPRPLILQQQRPGTDRDIGAEVAVLRAARAAGVPVPEVEAASAESELLGAPFMIVTEIAGETIARKILREDAYATARRELPAQLGKALAALHSVPPEAVPELTATDQIDQYRELLDELGEAHPAFEIGFRWLAANRPETSGPVVVHGDFRLGNLIVDERGLAAVLDWELAHLGDPMEDLGWLCVKAWRFGGRPPVAGLGEYEALFESYAGASGRPVEPAVVHWWEVLGTLKWGIMCIVQANAHLSGMSRSHELAAIGRRVSENEYDLLLLLG